MTDIKKILVGVDFSEGSELAVREALVLAKQSGASVTLGYVNTYVSSAIYAQAYTAPLVVSRFEQEQNELQKENQKRLDEIKERYAGEGVEIDTETIGGFPETGLADLVEKTGSDLLVVGTHGRTGWKRMLLGSVAEKAIRYCESDVLISRGQSIGKGVEHIIIPTDFSPVVDRCMALALSVIKPGGKIELVHASGDLFSIAIELDEAILSAKQGLEQEGQDLAAKYQRDDIEVSFVLDERPATLAIQHRSEEHTPDLIVMGSHGRKGPKRWILGSVAEKTVRHAPCSVAIIHHEG